MERQRYVEEGLRDGTGDEVVCDVKLHRDSVLRDILMNQVVAEKQSLHTRQPVQVKLQVPHREGTACTAHTGQPVLCYTVCSYMPP